MDEKERAEWGAPKRPTPPLRAQGEQSWCCWYLAVTALGRGGGLFGDLDNGCFVSSKAHAGSMALGLSQAGVSFPDRPLTQRGLSGQGLSAPLRPAPS